MHKIQLPLDKIVDQILERDLKLFLLAVAETRVKLMEPLLKEKTKVHFRLNLGFSVQLTEG